MQLALAIPGWQDLHIEPTTAMQRGEQEVYQHSWCGTVIVVAGLDRRTNLGPCPACHRPDDPWTKQTLPLAGIHTTPEPEPAPATRTDRPNP